VRRRALLVGGALATLATPAGAQTRPTISILHSGFPERTPVHLLIDALRTLGYEDGRSATIEVLGAEGSPDRLNAQVARLTSARPAVIVAITPPAVLALQRAGLTTPIVFLFVTDPVGLGIADSLSRPGRNITGVASGDTGIGAKRLELLTDAIADVRRVAVLWGDNAENTAILDSIRAAAAARGIALFVREIRGVDDFAPAFADARRAGAQAAVYLPDNIMFGHRPTVSGLAIANRLPMIHAFSTEVEDGGLMSFSVNMPDRYRRAAVLADAILKGARPADLPIEQPTTFTLAVNVRTAAAMGIVLPASFLAPTR
jgi:putative ABC transport system substrate-binding protein